MVAELITAEEFEESVDQDRAAAIREAAKKNVSDAKDNVTSAITSEASKRVLDKFFLNVNNSIWGLSFMLFPLLGLTLLMSVVLILALFLKKILGSVLETKGFSLDVGLLATMYTWGTFIIQLLLTVLVYSIIYMIANPVDFTLDAIGL
ncbi:MAG: hypothetical protein ACKKL6_00660 [Candidatus Komeilibacteria bacterium]